MDANKGKLEVQQAVITDLIEKIPKVVPLYEADIRSGKKLSLKEKQMLEYVHALGKPPGWVDRIGKILADPRNFAL